FASHGGKVGTDPFERLRSHSYGFAQGRMRMDSLADIHSVGAHFDCQGDFANEIAGMGSYDTTSDDAVRFSIEQQLGKAFVASIGNSPARSSPGEQAFLDLYSLCLGLFFGQANPGDFRIGVRHRRNDTRVEKAFLASDYFGSNMAFVYCLVCKHRLADDITNGVNMRDVRTHLRVDLDEAPVTDVDAGLVGINVLAVG